MPQRFMSAHAVVASPVGNAIMPYHHPWRQDATYPQEVFYGDGKGSLGLAKAQVRYEDEYAQHWALVFLAHTLVMYHRMKGSFSGLVEKRGSPVSARECA